MIRVAEDSVRQQDDVDRRVVWARVAAHALARAGHMPQARAIVESACRRHPQGDLALARWMATQPDLTADALQICLEMARGGDTQPAATLAAVSLQHATAPPELASRAESLLHEALSQTASLELLQEASRLRETQGQIDQALELARQAQRQSPQNPALNNNLAWYLGAYQRQSQPALELVNQAIGAAGPLRALLDTKAVILIQSGRAEHAAWLLETAALEPDAPASTCLHLAAAYAATDRPTEARRALEQAAKLGLRGELPFDRQLADRLKSALGKKTESAVGTTER